MITKTKSFVELFLCVILAQIHSLHQIQDFNSKTETLQIPKFVHLNPDRIKLFTVKNSELTTFSFMIFKTIQVRSNLHVFPIIQSAHF